LQGPDDHVIRKTEEKAATLSIVPIAYMVTYFTVYTLLTGLEKGRKSSKLSMVRTAYFLLVTYLIVYTLLTSLENG
jgi:hypothetical protein